MIRIGIDGNEANVARRVGISEYAYQLLLHFNTNSKGVDFTVFLKNKVLSQLPHENSYYKYEFVAPSRLWTQIGLPLRLFRKKRCRHFFYNFSLCSKILSCSDCDLHHGCFLFPLSRTF